MDNKSLLPLVAAAAYLLLNKNTSCHPSKCSIKRASDNNFVTVEVLGPSGTSVLMPPTTVAIDDDATVLSASIDSFKANQLAFQTGGSGPATYITSISGLAQQSAGPLSGWLYKVNATFPDLGPSVNKINPGDTITWVFTVDLGKDVDAPAVIFERRNRKTDFNNFNFR